MTIPETPDGVTVEWLINALGGSGALPGDVRVAVAHDATMYDHANHISC